MAASYSRYDLELLDRIDAALRQQPLSLAVDVFNVGDLRDQVALARYYPGGVEVLSTPVVGVWDSGNMIRFETGAEARLLIESVLNLQP